MYVPWLHSMICKCIWLWSKVVHNTMESFTSWSLIYRWHFLDVSTKCLLLNESTNFFTGFGVWVKRICEWPENTIGNNGLRGLNHFFFLPFFLMILCLHDGKSFPCFLCLLWMWLSTESHLAWIISPSPSGVDTADQYRWLTRLFFHSPTNSQSFSLASASIFFPKAVKIIGIVLAN